MNIKKIAWSKQRENALINFYALDSDSKGGVVIYKPDFAWASMEDALGQINKERANRNVPPHNGSILHVVLDMSSGALYLPEGPTKQEMLSNDSAKRMYDAIRMRIEKTIDIIPLADPIVGDPFETIRIRKIRDFYSVSDFIRRQAHNVQEFEKSTSLPVIEANLSIMPTTEISLFGSEENASKKNYLFVPENKVVLFSVKENRNGTDQDVVIHEQKGPFILINASPANHISSSDKERIIVTAYKEYADKSNVASDQRSPDIQSFKYLMYIGWSLKELCLVAFKNGITDFASLIYSGSFLYNAAKLLKSEGYPDPSSKYYYFTFKVDDSCPFTFTKQDGILYDYQSQPEIFRVIAFDPKTSYITIKTPLYFTEDLVKRVLKSKSEVFISEYIPSESAVKVNAPLSVIKAYTGTAFQACVQDVDNVYGKENQKIKVESINEIDATFERKHISNYPQAAEILKDICEKLSTKPDHEARSFPRKINFDDLEIVLGPWQQSMDILGGYVDAKNIKSISGGKPMLEPIPGLKVYPPVILIDNQKYKSVGDRTNIIIHEYRHHINTQLWIHSPEQDRPSEKDSPEVRIQKHVEYLRSPDEQIAHKAQFKYMLAIGMTKDQILRDVMNGKPTIKDAPIVKEYIGIINKADKELKEDRKEIESTEKMKEEIRQREEKELSSGFEDYGFFDPNSNFEL